MLRLCCVRRGQTALLSDVVQKATAMNILSNARAAPNHNNNKKNNSNNNDNNNNTSAEVEPEPGTWPFIVRKQRELYTDAHTPGPSSSGCHGLSSVNMAHVEGVVGGVSCGHPLGYREGGRRAVSMGLPGESHSAVVQLWLRVGAAEDAGAPLMARCSLSDECIHALWSAGNKDNSNNNAESSGSVDVAAELDWLQTSLTAKLVNKTIILSGELRMETRYDADVDRNIVVPYVRLPRDGLHGAYWVIK